MIEKLIFKDGANKNLTHPYANKGITLIALIITIIVLLILAGVSITILTGENGILKQAEYSKNKMSIEELKEEVNLVFQQRRIINETLGSNISLKEDLEKGISGNKIIEQIRELTDVYYVTKNNNSITVYEDGTIEDGKLDIWDGKSKSKPTIDNEGNWHIYTTNELKYFADFINGTLTEEEKGSLQITDKTIVYLESNLDLGARQIDGKLTRGTAWTSIGIGSNRFIGTFEGNNYFVKGVYVKQTAIFAGFFGTSSNKIKDLVIKSSYIEGSKYVGGIVGGIPSGNVEGCKNIDTKVKGDAAIGGIVGYINSNCYVSGCTNEGEVFSNQEGIGIGGIVGQAQKNSGLEYCYNSGRVTKKAEGENATAGIIGIMNTNVNVQNCVNFGTIEGDGYRIGGICGTQNREATISQCINIGNITGKLYAIGGIVGYSAGVIEESYNEGNIKCINKENAYRVSGICGDKYKHDSISSNLKNCYNIGNIIVESETIEKVGGLVGEIRAAIQTDGSKVEITNNYNIGNIEVKGNSISQIGGIIGGSTTEDILDSNNYYKEGITATEENVYGESKLSEQMKTDNFIKLLNTGAEQQIWGIKESENKGYPIILKLTGLLNYK